MMKPVIGVLLGIVLLTAAACPLVASAATGFRDEPLNTVTAIAAIDDTVAYSRRQPDGSFALMFRRGPRRFAANIPTRPHMPFDVDLGRRADGTLVAVYSRCTSEIGLWTIVTQGYGGEGCHLYTYDLHRRREALLDVATPEGASDVGPQVWGDNIVFFRLRESADAALTITLMVADLTRPGSASAIWTVPAGTAVTGADLRGSAVVVTSYGLVDDNPMLAPYTSVTRMTLTNPRPQVVAYATSATPQHRGFFSPQLTSSGLLYGDGYDAPNPLLPRAIRWITTSGTHASLPVSLPIASIAVAHDQMYFATAPDLCQDPHSGCALTRRALPRSLGTVVPWP